MKLTLLWIVVWPILRQLIGWLFIMLGILGLIMPILNGVIPLFIGIMLVGRRHPLIRWVGVRVKLIIRRWAALETPVIGWLGRLAQRIMRETMRQQRRMLWWYEGWRAARQARALAQTNTSIDS